MLTSFPTSKLGSDIGMSAPWIMPRLKPAGLALCSRETSIKFNVHPTAAAVSRTRKTRKGILQRSRYAELTVTSELFIFAAREHVFYRAEAASRIPDPLPAH